MVQTAKRSQAARRVRRPQHRGGSFLRLFLGVFAVLLLARALLPVGVRAYVNHVLDGMPGYEGRIGELDLNLWRGAYEVEGLVLAREGRQASEPFLEVQRMDLSVSWPALAAGAVVGEVVLHHPVMTFVVGGEEPSQTGRGPAWMRRLDALFPFRIERFAARDGEVRFAVEGTDPPVDLYVDDFYLEAHGLTNVRGPAGDEQLSGEAEAAGRPFGTAELEARMRFDPFAARPRFELDAAARDVPLTDMNDFLRALGRFDAESGTVDVYAEFAAQEGEVEGYVKTLFDDVRILSLGEIDGPEDALEAFWEGLVELGAELLENQPKGKVAAYVPLTGRSDDLGSDVVTIAASVLRNAFVAAMRPAIDESIELTDLEVARKDEGEGGEKEFLR